MAQMELMQLFAQDLDPQELTELRKLLVAFRFKLVEQRAERLVQEKGWTDEHIDQMSQDHYRTDYQAKAKFNLEQQGIVQQ